MVPHDPHAIAAAIEAGLKRLSDVVASDRASVAADRELPEHVRHDGTRALDALAKSADEVMSTLRARNVKATP